MCWYGNSNCLLTLVASFPGLRLLQATNAGVRRPGKEAIILVCVPVTERAATLLWGHISCSSQLKGFYPQCLDNEYVCVGMCTEKVTFQAV